MDLPELFHAANVGDLDLLMRAFDMDIGPWTLRKLNPTKLMIAATMLDFLKKK